MLMHTCISQYTAITTAMVGVIACFYSMIFEGSTLLPANEVSGSVTSCLLGWTGSAWLLKMVVFGLVNGVVCQAGFNYAVSA